MIYLATPNTVEVRQHITGGRLGALLTPDSWPNVNEPISATFPWVGLDNGCFAETWEEATWKEWLGSMTPRQPECLFAVVPDVVGDATATAERWERFAPIVADLGFPLAYVAQDGLHYRDLPWRDLDALFVGGSTGYKLSESAYAAAAEARRRGKWVHMGRVNSFRRIRAAALSGFDSVDGTYLAFGPDTNLPKLLAWLDWIDAHPPLALLNGVIA